MTPLDDALTLAGAAFASALWVVLAGKRVFTTSPAFFALLTYYLVSDLAAELVRRYFPALYLRFYLLTLPVELLLFFCVLAEIGKNILHYNRVTQLRRPVMNVLFVSAVLLACLLTSWTASPGRSLLSNIYALTMKAVEILEFAGFLTLVLWSSIRELSWPDRELRIATGLGISSFVWFVIAILHAWWTAGAAYHLLDQAGLAVYIVIIAYWLYSFWFEADRGAATRHARAGLAASRDRRKGSERTQRLVGSGIGCGPIHNEDLG